MNTSLPRIAIVAPSMRILGGQALHARTLAEQLRSEGYEVELIPIDPAFPRGFRWVRRLSYVRTVVNQCLYLPSLSRLRRADIVVASTASYWSFMLAPVPAILMARALRKPVVLNYHSGEAADHLANWGAWIHPWLKLVDEIVVPSQYLQKVFGAFGYRVRVIHNTVDTSRFRFRERTPLRPRFLSTRNFEWFYGVEQTLIAFALVKTRYPEATLAIAGMGRQEDELRRLVQALGVGGVRFLGALEPAAMPALHDGEDIFLNSSVIDNQPLSVLEAAASGMPIVSTDVGDVPNMIEDGVAGTIVPKHDPAAMAHAASLVLEQPERARRMAQHAYERLDRFSWEAVRGQWMQLWADMMRSPRSAQVDGDRRAA